MLSGAPSSMLGGIGMSSHAPSICRLTVDEDTKHTFGRGAIGIAPMHALPMKTDLTAL